MHKTRGKSSRRTGIACFPGKTGSPNPRSKDSSLDFLHQEREKQSTNEEDTDEESIEQDDVSHMTTVETAFKEIGLCPPIVYDIYDLCDYTRRGKLTSFTVSMLKDICTVFDLQFRSRDTKAVLISKVKQMISECSCSVEG